jgi:hypothetical protein
MEYFLLVGFIALLHWTGRAMDVGTVGVKIIALAILAVPYFIIYINYSRFSKESAILDALVVSIFVLSGYVFEFDRKVSFSVLAVGLIIFGLVNFSQLFGVLPGRLLNYPFG